ncbi:MAG: hypothetical protein Q9186_005187, partial [Xanthomendoza sp. 1 TL-2023]
MSTLTNLLSAGQSEDPAVIIPGDTGLTIKYGVLTTQCQSLQKQLADLGIGHGTAVSISLPNSVEFVAVFLAICWQRAIAAPLNPTYKEQEVQFYLDDLDAAAIIVPRNACEQKSPAVLAARKRNAAVIECYTVHDQVEFEVKEAGQLEGKGKKGVEEAQEEDVALVLHTSGTTDNIIKTYTLTRTDRTLIIMPLFHVHGLIASFLSPLRSSSAIILPSRLSPSFWKDFTTHSATWYTATPTMHKILLSFPPPPSIPPIRFIRSCSSPLSPQTLRTLESTFHAPVLEAYAMTEASHQITSNPLPPLPHHPGSVGLPGGDIQLLILGENDTPVPQGEEGEICISSASITNGYISNSTANASNFLSFPPSPSSTDDARTFFRTGDHGRLDAETGYLYLTGRIKEFINKGGEKISPVELDNLLAMHPAVADVVVFGIEDEMYGQDVGAAVMLKDGEEVGEKEMKKWIRGRIAPLKVPKK